MNKSLAITLLLAVITGGVWYSYMPEREPLPEFDYAAFEKAAGGDSAEAPTSTPAATTPQATVSTSTATSTATGTEEAVPGIDAEEGV